MIVTRGLTKTYSGRTVVDAIDLDVREGERYGFLGPNGSGKTTTVRMLLGLVYATRGEIELLGHSVPKQLAAALPQVGALVEGPAGYGHLSARANLELFDAAGPRSYRTPRGRRRARIDDVLDQVGLGGVGRKPVRAYSLGMRQRLGLAAALIRRPRLLVLDEPTNGLDPQGIQEVRQLLLGLNQDGTTIFLSSHLLAEVEQLCTRVGVMNAGALVAQVSMDEVRRPTGRALLRVGDPEAALAVLNDLTPDSLAPDGPPSNGSVAHRDGDRLVVTGLPIPELTRRLVQAGIAIHEVVPERHSLERMVLDLTGPGSDRVAS